MDAPGEDLKLYTGGCECGAVQVALKSKPLNDIEIKEDNCSICVRVRLPLLRTDVLSCSTRLTPSQFPEWFHRRLPSSVSSYAGWQRPDTGLQIWPWFQRLAILSDLRRPLLCKPLRSARGGPCQTSRGQARLCA